jgi:hypothetical protein
MGVSPDDFDDHYGRILDDYDDEISRRCAISRGYYYAFHYVRQVGSSHPEGNFSNGYGDHKKAKQFCSRIGNSGLANQLNELHRRRKQADYDLDDDIDEMDVDAFRMDLDNFLTEFKMNLSGV